MKHKSIVLCHGFGFDSSYWTPFLTEFLALKLEVTLWDLGYFKNKQQTNLLLKPQTEYIGIGHSLGFQKIMTKTHIWSHVIGLNGFFDFLGEKEDVRKKRMAELSTLKKNFYQSPEKTLEFFYKRTGVSSPPCFPWSSIQQKRFLSDLDCLQQPVQKPICPYTLFLSQNDSIVPSYIFDLKAHGQNIFFHGEDHCLGSKNDKVLFKKIIEILKI